MQERLNLLHVALLEFGLEHGLPGIACQQIQKIQAASLLHIFFFLGFRFDNGLEKVCLG